MSADAIACLGKCQDPEAERILGWPEHFVDALQDRLLAVHSNSALAAGDMEDLRNHGLLQEESGKPSAFGRHLLQLLVSEEWQEGDEFAALLPETAIEAEWESVLDVGCSTGRRLRKLAIPSLSKRVGVDVDAKAVALGSRLARQEDQEVSLACCSAHSLSFPDASFDVVICRNALTYMHHRTALGEMTRVLKPNGLLFIRFENIRYDLQLFFPPRGLKSSLVFARNFFAGLTLAALGWQPTPGSRLWGWRAFATLRQLRKIMRQGQCEIVRVEEARNCPRFMGSATQTSLLARKSQ
jgi:SAM-dependent methyltransferase